MASRAVIPRFLLPLQGPLWRGVRIPLSQNILVRFASTDAGRPQQKPIVLQKPAKFNPPSHGSRLKRGNSLPRHYGPELTSGEVAAQGKRDYPGLMAPQGSWAHWFWHSRLLHTVITMVLLLPLSVYRKDQFVSNADHVSSLQGTLLAMGIYTFFLNYAYNSPFKDLVPPISDLWAQPTYFFAQWKNVIAMHEKDKALKASEHRTRHLDDVAKRQYYMKTHGIEAKDPVTMVFGKDDQRSVEELEATALGRELPPKQEGEGEEKPVQRKKWFGIL
ncbi:CAAX prenyl protease 2 [Purpureocillium lavendulum]|uniref:CAAX prenyl protease 2 n=1 Tax=Purpureocillium lavendulum TaxID=1247861 RepID=A0AB34FQD4_9HYPO|nr:CAAX prenyl protease 2 [Purpureocillium lavendulum]